MFLKALVLVWFGFSALVGGPAQREATPKAGSLWDPDGAQVSDPGPTAPAPTGTSGGTTGGDGGSSWDPDGKP